MNWRKLLAAGIMVALQQQLTPTLQFYSSNPSRSLYTDVAGHGLANFRVGFRSRGSWDVYTWVKNAFDKDYFESLTAATGGNTGLVVGQPAGSRTWGLTVRAES